MDLVTHFSKTYGNQNNHDCDKLNELKGTYDYHLMKNFYFSGRWKNYIFLYRYITLENMIEESRE